jgi:hypothetical protein
VRRDWDAVLDSMSRKAKVRFSGVAVREVRDGTVVVAFPNDVHRNRCDEFRAELQHALAARYGSSTNVQYVTDEAAAARAGGGAPAGRGAPVPDAPPAPEPDEHIDLAELTDAPSGGGIIEQLTSAFPGAELVDRD